MAYSAKFKVGWLFKNVFSLDVGHIYNHAQVEPYLNVMGATMVLWIITFYFMGLYKVFTGIMPLVDELLQLFKANTLVIILMAAATFSFGLLPGSRYVLAYTWIFSNLLLGFSRLIIFSVELRYMSRGVGTLKTLVVGADAVGQDVVERIFLYPSFGLSYVGTIDDNEPKETHFHLRGKFNLIGKVDELYDKIKETEAKALFVTSHQTDLDLKKLIDTCERKEIALKIFPEETSFMSSLAGFESVDGLPFITYTPLEQLSLNHIIKRIMDIIISGISMILLFPLFIGLTVYIKLVSPSGPALFVQDRITLNDKVFGMLKFRTMIPDAEKATGPVMVNEKEETRYIRGGALIRKLSLDELPQLWNVFKGEMSIVGPRPERPHFVEEFEKDIPNFRLRHKVRGGITGWAQINGRSVLTRRPDHKFKYDLYYVKNWSLVLDLKIIIKTFWIVGKREEAY